MQEDFNVWPPPPKGQSPPQPSPPLRPPVSPAIRRLGREALVLVALAVLDLLVSPQIIDHLHEYSGYIPTHADVEYFNTFYFCAAAPFLFLGVYKGWRGRAAWTGKVAFAVGGGFLVPFVPLFIVTLRDALR